MIDRDLSCLRCGYNLRGLRENSLCPECACPIVESVKGPWLGAADRRWLRRIVIGAMVVGCAFVAMTSAEVLIASGAGPRILFAWVILFGAVGVLRVVGVWMISSLQHRESFIEPRLRPWLMRVLATVAAISYGLWSIAAGALLCQGGPTFPNPVAWVLWALRASSQLFWVSVPLNFLLLQHVAGLSARIPAANLARQARWSSWVVPGIEAALYAMTLGPLVVTRIRSEQLIKTLQWCWTISYAWATTVVFLAAWQMLCIYRKRAEGGMANLDSDTARRTIPTS